jgi:hypothetical protein
MRTSIILGGLIALGAVAGLAANARAEDLVAAGKGNEVGGLRLTLVEKTPPSTEPSGVVPQKALFLRWENMGTNALSLGGLFESACASGRVFVKEADGTTVPEREYREQGYWTERLIEPGKTIETDFNPWFWVRKPEKPGLYEVWVEYELAKEGSNAAPRRVVSAGYWKGKIISNRLKLEVK